ncbi:50S ribosomal protein L11 methyltransferase, partial [Francisella tularensis subsp. holarctica]|nr:50S ribosomal protein L11 methyltransferase [Francisella tularensis subsp. holarctica]
MQPWHQLEFRLKSKYFDRIENYLFDNDAGSVPRIDKSEDIVRITGLY